MTPDPNPTLAALNAETAAGRLTARRHPHLPLTVYAYARDTADTGNWTPTALAARGLVVDDTGRIRARPFPKFFNVHEHDLGLPWAPPLAGEPETVYPKIDGSLGVVFHYGGRWIAATRRSFESDQAMWAQAYLDAAATHRLDPARTYCVEIVYPAGRVIVDNGHREDLVLLAAFDTGTGAEIPFAEAARDWHGIGSTVLPHPPVPLTRLRALAADNRDYDGHTTTGTRLEGWVVRYGDGTRVKVKLADYIRLSRIDLTDVDLWQAEGIRRHGPTGLKPGILAITLKQQRRDLLAYTNDWERPMKELTEALPPERHPNLRARIDQFDRDLAALEAVTATAWTALAHLDTDRKAFAAAAARHPKWLSGWLFARLDKNFAMADLILWGQIEPHTPQPLTW